MRIYCGTIVNMVYTCCNNVVIYNICTTPLWSNSCVQYVWIHILSSVRSPPANFVLISLGQFGAPRRVTAPNFRDCISQPPSSLLTPPSTSPSSLSIFPPPFPLVYHHSSRFPSPVSRLPPPSPLRPLLYCMSPHPSHHNVSYILRRVCNVYATTCLQCVYHVVLGDNCMYPLFLQLLGTRDAASYASTPSTR